MDTQAGADALDIIRVGQIPLLYRTMSLKNGWALDLLESVLVLEQ